MSYTTIGQIGRLHSNSIALGFPGRKRYSYDPLAITNDALKIIRAELPQPIAEAIEEANPGPRPPNGFVCYIGGGPPNKTEDYWYDDEDCAEKRLDDWLKKHTI